MEKSKVIKDNLSQIFAITEKNIQLNLRFKFKLLFNLISPVLTIIIPLIVLSRFFEYNAQFGPWNVTNFLIFQFLAFNINLLRKIIKEFITQLTREKIWKTLPALIIGPINHFNLLIGIFFSKLILISIPFTFFFILAYIYYPIYFMTLIFILFLYFLLAFLFSGIGLLLGVYMISKEGTSKILLFFIGLIFWFSCITYPLQIFPKPLQDIINLNPFFYIFDLLRVSWIQNNVFFTLTTCFLNFILLILFATIIPIISLIAFNKLYKKYGIVGY